MEQIVLTFFAGVGVASLAALITHMIRSRVMCKPISYKRLHKYKGKSKSPLVSWWGINSDYQFLSIDTTLNDVRLRRSCFVEHNVDPDYINKLIDFHIKHKIDVYPINWNKQKAPENKVNGKRPNFFHQ